MSKKVKIPYFPVISWNIEIGEGSTGQWLLQPSNELKEVVEGLTQYLCDTYSIPASGR